ncbi:hypothetical protein EPUL_003888 [Erysiphe pulchra]|uniref:Interferon-related developmental regulator N-terminal domain-containing protein n=1 Tax=Erysiphe pulchra TaxID=225359 RepID=A0A2S4PU06_9PEZI|nr:hypothetical protein EPUL_003888 [Erysiphe pulchra]
MRDLRGQALESKKTVSRKAKLRESERASQTPKLRSNLQGYSCHGVDTKLKSSDCENLTETVLNDEKNLDVVGKSSDIRALEIKDLIEEIKEKKRSTTQGREKALSRYANNLMNHYAFEEITGKSRELTPALLRSIKGNVSEKEACNALLAITLTVITIPSEVNYDFIEQELKRTYRDSKFNHVKATAIYSLSVAAPYAGASEFEIDEIMDELIDIVESDGNSIAAPDNAEVVVAACEAWGHLATFLDDLESKTETAMDAFMEQLKSSDSNVQIAAGENIALLYESSYTEREAEDGPASKIYDDEGFLIDSSRVKRYEVYRHKDQLLYTLTGLKNESSKHIAKRDRKNLHTSFSDIINTIEYPTRGPRFQNAIDVETGNRYGSRMKVRMKNKASLEIDKWWKMFRLNALKEVLGGGFLVHFQTNDAIIDSIGFSN